MEPVEDLRTRGELLAAGFTDAEVRRLRRTGSVATLARGTYLPSDDARLREPRSRHALRVRAALPRLAVGSVASHVSAAVLHGLDVWDVPLDRVHVTRVGSGGRISRRLHVHVAPLDADEIVVVDGVAVTSLARTVTDVARTVDFVRGVVVADSGLIGTRDARGTLDRGALDVAVERVARWRGGPAALRVARFANGLAESPGESRSRIAMRDAGLPPPVLQQPVRTADGVLVGRADFGWPDLRTVGEFDGRTKYGRLLRPGQDPGEVVYREKLREDAIRAEGWSVVRWTWGDLECFAPVAAGLRGAFHT
ncbi:MAG: hypothetical protein OJJ54_24050 [Pseudonocardia sp.]|nr:hypothetical protein [Pseudonocardia sp.]